MICPSCLQRHANIAIPRSPTPEVEQQIAFNSNIISSCGGRRCDQAINDAALHHESLQSLGMAA